MDKLRWSFDDFMDDVYSQLECNATEEYKSKYIVFTYSEEDIKSHIEYFKKCYKDHLSAYKALTFFCYELKN